MPTSQLPIAIVGAGPVGLAAAAHLVRRGEEPLPFEMGTTAASSVLKWGHVRLFSPWRYLIDGASASLLVEAGWNPPPADLCPTGRDLFEQYLRPLAETPQLRTRIRLCSRVLTISRRGFDKMKSAGRERAPYVLSVQTDDGVRDVLARGVIDASGTYLTPNPLGASGTPALGEIHVADRVLYGIPDASGPGRHRYAGKRVLVVGSGHSAFNALLEVRKLRAAGTAISWAIRRTSIANLFDGQNDELQERARLASRVREMAETGEVQVLLRFAIESLASTEAGIQVTSESGERVVVDEVIAATGYRPNLEITRELRLTHDWVVESPSALAPLIDPNVHTCRTVPVHGAEQLAHPDKDFYVVGMKSYGRAPTFLMPTGYEQVRSVAAALTRP